MQTSVSLEEPFTYNIVPIIVVGVLLCVLICVPIILYLYNLYRLKKLEVKKINYKDLLSIRNKYLMELNNLQNNVNNISVREAYIKLSEIIRMYIYEVTNIKVQNYSLYEISFLNMPKLYNLVSEYYVSEFSYKEQGNILESINKTRGVIESWN